jgi:Leucine-rich repeat (LRR) protein
MGQAMRAHPSIRQEMALLPTVALACVIIGWATPGAAIRAARAEEPCFPEARTDPDEKLSPAIRFLLKQRREVLREVFVTAQADLKAGRHFPEHYLTGSMPAAARALLAVELELGVEPTAAVTAYQALVDTWTKHPPESRVNKPSILRLSKADILLLQTERLEAEIGLLRAKSQSGEKTTAQLQKLLKRRCDLLEQISDLGFVQLSGRRLCDARLAVAATPADRVKAHRAFLDVAKKIETSTKEAVDAGRMGSWDLLDSTSHRLEAEIALERAMSLDAGKDSKKVRELLKTRRDVLRDEFEALAERQRQGVGGPVPASVSRSLLEAQLALTKDPGERLAAFQKHFDHMKMVEEGDQARYKAGAQGPLEYLSSKGARLEAEVWLVRAKSHVPARKPATPAQDEKPNQPKTVAERKEKPLPAEVRAAWEKAGAEAGWMAPYPFGWGFRTGSGEGEADEIPPFHWRRWQAGMVAKLPAPDVRFGLYLNGTQVTDVDLKELAGLKQLQALNLGFTKTTDAGLKELAGLKQLKALNLGFTKVTDAGLKELAGLRQLQLLNIGFTKVTDAGLKELAGFEQLQAVHLGSTAVTNAGLKDLAGLKQLQALSLDSTAVTDAGLKELAGFKKLATLDLSCGGVSNEGLKELAPLQNLSTLDLRGARVTDAGLKDLACLERLQAVSLWYAQVTDAGVKELARLKKLHSLDLYGTQVTDAGLQELAGFKQLQSLNLGSTKVTDAGLKQLAWLTKLRSLNLSFTRVTDRGLKDLAGLKQLESLTGLRQLQSLNLSHTQVTDAGLKELAGLQQLQSLNLSHTRVTDAGLTELAGLKHLHALDLGYTGLTDGGLKELAGLKQLQFLALNSTAVTDSGLKELEGLTQLHALDLGITKVTDAGLKELARLKQLQSLEVGSTKVTDAGIQQLEIALPGLRIERRWTVVPPKKGTPPKEE